MRGNSNLDTKRRDIQVCSTNLDIRKMREDPLDLDSRKPRDPLYFRFRLRSRKKAGPAHPRIHLDVDPKGTAAGRCRLTVGKGFCFTGHRLGDMVFHQLGDIDLREAVEAAR